MAHDHSNDKVLTGGIGRILVGIVVFGCVLAALQIVAVNRLQYEIDKWAWTSEMNGQREELLSGTSAFLANDMRGGDADIIPLFVELRTTIGTGLTVTDRAEIAQRVSELENNARQFFLEADQRRSEVAPLREEILRRIAQLGSISSDWSAQLRTEELQLTLQSNNIETRTQQLVDIRTTLTSALLSAQLLQQQIIAIDRLVRSSQREIAMSSIESLSVLGMPPPCGQGQKEADGRLCAPNSARVIVALNRLKSSDSGAMARNTRGALLGLEGYARAGQNRLKSLDRESEVLLNQARTIRLRQANLRGLNTSLVRINRLLQDMARLLEDPVKTLDDLTVADSRIRSILTQLPFRMKGVVEISSMLDDQSTVVDTNIATMAREWTEVHDKTLARLDLLDQFSRTMGELSVEIEEQDARVRADTTLWVNIYVTSFVILAILVIASIVSFVTFARRRLIAPLAQVTGTILGMARGELDRPLALQERAFGFNRLSQALEQLRSEMSERQSLMEHNKKQQRVIATNLADLERTYDEMEWMALHDPLTELGNRRNADSQLAKATAMSEQSGSDFCIMHIDIDRFKSVNDTLGHAAGDFVLKSVACILIETAPSEAGCFRIGGDEFLIIWPGQGDETAAVLLGEKIVGQIALPIDFEGHRCEVGSSIGIAFGRDAGGDAMQAMKHADLALYSVKRRRSEGCALFTDELASMANRRKDISERLIAAVEGRSFQPFYQPQFKARHRNLRGVEVLCRWHDEVHGWVPPGEFLPIAEDLGLVGAIDDVLIQKVSVDLEMLASRGKSIPRVSFNITADRLLRADVAEQFERMIAPHATVAVELLESMSLDNPTEAVKWAIDSLAERGIEIEIDDFGSDRASLAGLMAVKPKAMKIDRSIVIPIVDSERHQDLVKKIIDIGAALGIEVVAEGVESEEHADLLLSYGCDILQGFGLAKPMPIEELAMIPALSSDRVLGDYATG